MKHSALVLFMCAGLLLSGGAILGGSSTWSLLRISYYFWTTDLSVELAGSVLFIVGALLCLPTCWLATLVPYHPKSQSLLATLLCVATAALMVLSIAMVSAAELARALRDPPAVNASMLRALALDGFDPSVRAAFSAMQIDLRCCGVSSPRDWEAYGRPIPPSCCGRMRKTKHRNEPCDSPLYVSGCLRPAMIEMRNYTLALTALATAIIIILAVTVFAAAYTLVTGAVERPKTMPQPLRVAYLTPAPPTLAPFPAPNLVSNP